MQWELELLSWTGITARAKHSYAVLRDESMARIEVRWPIDQATADEWNADDPEIAEISPWRAGEQSERFNSREQAETCAIAHWRTLAQPGDVLLEPWSRREIARCLDKAPGAR